MLLRREGWVVNHKRVYRIYRQEGLAVRKRKSKRVAGWRGEGPSHVIPELNTVVVFTGGNFISYRPPFELLNKYILPAFN